jgi:hypothetical protein
LNLLACNKLAMVAEEKCQNPGRLLLHSDGRAFPAQFESLVV